MSAFQSSNSPSSTESSEPADPVETPAELVEDDQVIETPESEEEEGDGSADEPKDYDRAAIETRYGLPSGSLADFDSEESALSAIRAGIDQSFMQTLYQEHGKELAPAPASTPGEATDAQKKGQEVAAGSLEALQKKVAELENTITQQTKRQQEQVTREVTEQASKVIDGWNSARYGTSKSRTFKQAENLRGMLGLVRKHTETLRNAGHPIPNVSTVMERIRLWHDEDYVPNKAKPAPQSQVGTPGGHQDAAPKGGATNIHNAVMGHFRK